MNKVLPYAQASEKLTLVEKIGQLFMPAAFINDKEEEIQDLEKLIEEQHVGGLCFFHSRASAATNFEGKKKIIYNQNSLGTLKQLIQRYQKAAQHPLLIAIDAEWGLAMRIENTAQYPYAITLGAIRENNALIFEMGKNIASDCKQAGIHWNLSPVVDITNNPNNPVIGYRSFGENREAVTNKALAYIHGTESEGILTSIKHFPGHGDTATDSHLKLPLIDKTKKELLENELYPFQKLIDQGIDSVMVGHLSVPALSGGKKNSSSLSKDIIKGILRTTMGFKGVVISDALNMHAISKDYPTKGELEWLAFDAGNDVLCFAEHIKEGIDTILKNATTPQIEDSFKRVWALKEKAIKPLPTGTISACINPDLLNAKIAKESLTLVKGDDSSISDFNSGDFIGISIAQSRAHVFFESINTAHPFDVLSSDNHSIGELKNRIRNQENIVLAVYPPHVKPIDSFGLTQEEIQFINELIQTRNVVLYLFGNPFVLNHINTQKAKAIVLIYQDFKVFQEVAAEHFMGNFKGNGKLAVRLGKSKLPRGQPTEGRLSTLLGIKTK
ncbi:MAG: glycoside hydrolase family 3 N-terminal domain-containing protein [Flavobacteriaceae bacterium]